MTAQRVEALQRYLALLGFYRGPLDGVWGPLTDDALHAAMRAAGDPDDEARAIAREIVVREGGFVNDPDDPGGPTNRGVTLKTLQALGVDLTGDGRVSIDDLKRVTPDQAAEIFLEHYFRARGLDKLPAEIRGPVFDMAVNAGAAGVVLLQTLLNTLGDHLAVDGVVGPKTIAAAEAAVVAMPRRTGQSLRDAYGNVRREYYFQLADRRPASRKYARRRDGGKGGWITRAEAFMSPDLHLSAAEFAARTKGWS